MSTAKESTSIDELIRQTKANLERMGIPYEESPDGFKISWPKLS